MRRWPLALRYSRSRKPAPEGRIGPAKAVTGGSQRSIRSQFRTLGDGVRGYPGSAALDLN